MVLNLKRDEKKREKQKKLDNKMTSTKKQEYGCLGEDLNLRHKDFQSFALTN